MMMMMMMVAVVMVGKDTSVMPDMKTLDLNVAFFHYSQGASECVTPLLWANLL